MFSVQTKHAILPTSRERRAKQNRETVKHRRVNGNGVYRLRSELELAKRVQLRMLPQNSKALATIRYAGLCAPAEELGGDYYDFIDAGPGALRLVLADVSGKGIPGALMAGNLQATVRSECAHDHDTLSEVLRLSDVLRAVNTHFFESTFPEQYATVFLAHYSDPSRCLRYVNCGHFPGIVLRGNGQVEWLEATTWPLGMFATLSCE